MFCALLQQLEADGYEVRVQRGSGSGSPLAGC
jgi:hypothetical protein